MCPAARLPGQAPKPLHRAAKPATAGLHGDRPGAQRAAPDDQHET